MGGKKPKFNLGEFRFPSKVPKAKSENTLGKLTKTILLRCYVNQSYQVDSGDMLRIFKFKTIS